jgi:signal transduction histidine kinase
VLPATIGLTLAFPADLPPALADVDQIRIVLGNLIRNARDAMPQGGQLTVTGRHQGEHVEVRVSDTGVGIPAENLTRGSGADPAGATVQAE